MDFREELGKQLQSKLELRQAQQKEECTEKQLLDESDAAWKKQQENLKMAKQEELECQKAFLQHQIDHRKKEDELYRQREIQYGKVVAELAKQEMEKEAAQIAHAKKMQNAENAKYYDYLSRARTDKKEVEPEIKDTKHTSFINKESDADSEMQREKKKQLNAFKKVRCTKS